MAAHQCLNCGQIEKDDCCENPDMFCINDMCEEIKRLRAELAALQEDLRYVAHSGMGSCAPAPAGWQLVPVEPTIGMCIAGDGARVNLDDATRTPAIYRAMLAAAPKGGE